MLTEDLMDGNDLERIVEDIQANYESQEEKENASEAEEVERRVVKPRKRVLRPQPKLDAQRLTGPRGIGVLKSVFKGIKLKGHGHEIKDLNVVITHLEHWAHRLFPKMTFDDCIDKIEDLGMKQAVKVNLTKIRLDMIAEETENENRSLDNEVLLAEDPFDQLVQTSQPVKNVLTQEQRERMKRNRRIAEERRMSRLKRLQDFDISNISQETSALSQ